MKGLSGVAPTLSVKQKLFVEAYAGDVVEALRVAGYQGDPRYLQQKGSELLREPKIIEALKIRSQYMATKIKVKADREERQEYWTNIMRNEDPDARPELDKDGNPLPENYKPNIPYAIRLKASELLGKSEGDFIDRIDMDTTISLTNIIMNSYQLPEGEDLPIEAIEAQYRAVRELRKKKKEEQEEIEDALLLEDKSDDSPYSFI
jgi:hypothetical protein